MKSSNMNFWFNWFVICFVFKIGKFRTLAHLLDLYLVCGTCLETGIFVKQIFAIKLWSLTIKNKDFT